MLSEALSALAALMRFLLEMHTNVVLAIAELFKLLPADQAAQNLIQTPGPVIQTEVLNKHRFGRYSFTGNFCRFMRLLTAHCQSLSLIALFVTLFVTLFLAHLFLIFFKMSHNQLVLVDIFYFALKVSRRALKF